MRSDRNASAASDLGREYVTRAAKSELLVSAETGFKRFRGEPSFASCRGIVPSVGRVEIVLISSIVLTLVSVLSSVKAANPTC